MADGQLSDQIYYFQGLTLYGRFWFFVCLLVCLRQGLIVSLRLAQIQSNYSCLGAKRMNLSCLQKGILADFVWPVVPLPVPKPN